MLEYSKKALTNVNTLLNGIPIFVSDFDSDADVSGRISVSRGTERATLSSYGAESFLPVDKWSALSDDELTLVSGHHGAIPRSGAERISVWKLPQQISMYFDGMRAAIRKHNNETVVANLFNHPDYRRGCAELAKLCRATGINDSMRVLGHYSRMPGLASTSIGEDGKFVGLHVDSWASGSISERKEGYPSRLCVNLGPEDRYFMFQNLSFNQIAEISNSPISDHPNQFVVDFLDSNPSYPVLKLRIKPGEAYIAPTEIMIHDATTRDKHYVDASVTILGDFTPGVVDALFSVTQF